MRLAISKHSSYDFLKTSSLNSFIKISRMLFANELASDTLLRTSTIWDTSTLYSSLGEYGNKFIGSQSPTILSTIVYIRLFFLAGDSLSAGNFSSRRFPLTAGSSGAIIKI